MRLCHVSDAADAADGGLYTATWGLARALAKTRLATSVSLVGRRLRVVPDTPPDGGRLRIATQPSWGAHLRSALFPRGESGSEWSCADLCHAHGMWKGASLVSLAWRLRTGKPLVVAPHGMLDEWALRKNPVAKKLALATYEGLRLHKATCIHALSAAEFASVGRLDLRLPAFVIPNGVDLPPERELERYRTGAVYTSRRKTLLYLGRLDPKKGIELVIHALAARVAHDRNCAEEWTFQIYGSGPDDYVTGLKRLAADLGLAGMVAFPGPIHGERKHEVLASSSAFVLTSYSEGLPMAVLEAWAYGLPSLISEQCNLSAPARAGAALLTATTAEDVSRQLGELLALGDRERTAMGKRARAHVERAHHWDQVCARMLDVYRWALGGGPRPEAM